MLANLFLEAWVPAPQEPVYEEESMDLFFLFQEFLIHRSSRILREERRFHRCSSEDRAAAPRNMPLHIFVSLLLLAACDPRPAVSIFFLPPQKLSSCHRGSFSFTICWNLDELNMKTSGGRERSPRQKFEEVERCPGPRSAHKLQIKRKDQRI